MNLYISNYLALIFPVYLFFIGRVDLFEGKILLFCFGSQKFQSLISSLVGNNADMFWTRPNFLVLFKIDNNNFKHSNKFYWIGTWDLICVAELENNLRCHRAFHSVLRQEQDCPCTVKMHSWKYIFMPESLAHLEHSYNTSLTYCQCHFCILPPKHQQLTTDISTNYTGLWKVKFVLSI